MGLTAEADAAITTLLAPLPARDRTRLTTLPRSAVDRRAERRDVDLRAPAG